MILNTGQRTDIPAFYSEWFYNRVREGYVLVRNPYYPQQVTRYRIHPSVVDVICFCSKDPAPMLPGLSALSAFRQYWHVTITPYGRDIEPGVPDKSAVIEAFHDLSRIVGREAVCWRYDPVFISEKYSVGFHKEAFAQMAKQLSDATGQVIVSFIDLYRKTRRNFPEAREVTKEEKLELGQSIAETGRRLGMRVYSCFEGEVLSAFGVDTGGCMTQAVLERAFGESFDIPAGQGSGARPGCQCLLSCDIGAYNSCGHLCRYCYANEDPELVTRNMRRHDPESPFLIGGALAGDEVREASQESWSTGQMRLAI